MSAWNPTSYDPDDFANRRHIGPSPAEMGAMLSAIGVETLDELIDQTVVDSPETVNEDPAGSWFFKIQPSDPSALDEYLSEDEYKALIN